jgi:predicted transposase YbfD/YdcC
VKFSSRNAVHIVAGKVFDRDQDKNERKIAPMAIKQLRKISRTYTDGKIMIKSSYMSAAL